MTEIVDELKYDWYAVLSCNSESSKSHIEKAARKLFLKYHPDKTSDPQAPELFLRVQKAKEILLDDTKRKIIDDAKRTVTKRQEYEDERSKNMDFRRKRMRDDLENKLQKNKQANVNIKQRSSNQSRDNIGHKDHSIDLDRLRKEGASLREAAARDAELQKEKRAYDFVSQKKALEKKNISDGGSSQIKIKWKRTRQSHSDESLALLFKVFGSIEAVSLIGDKGNAATILFTEEKSARNAVANYDASSEYRVTLPSDEIQDNKKRAAIFTHVYSSSSSTKSQGDELLSSKFQDNSQESDLLRQMRRAVERDELIRSLDSENNDISRSSSGNINTSSVNFDSSNNSNNSSINSSHDKPGASNQSNNEKDYNFSTQPLFSNKAPSTFMKTSSMPNLVSKEADVLTRMIEAAKLKKLKAQQAAAAAQTESETKETVQASN